MLEKAANNRKGLQVITGNVSTIYNSHTQGCCKKGFVIMGFGIQLSGRITQIK